MPVSVVAWDGRTLGAVQGAFAQRGAVVEGLENQCRCGCYPNIVAAVLDAGRPEASL